MTKIIWPDRFHQKLLALFGVVIVAIFVFVLGVPLILKQRLQRLLSLKKYGFYGGSFNKGFWIYEETHGGNIKTLRLKMENTEPGHGELFLPEDSAWRASVPDWAVARRMEIGKRIAEFF